MLMVRGAVVHKTIAEVCQGINASAASTDPKDKLMKSLRAAWKQQAGVIKALGLPHRQLTAIYRETETMLLCWLNRTLLNKITYHACEQRLYSRTYGVMGIIDAVSSLNKIIMLIDYKTGSSDEINRDIKVQLSIYALLYQEKYNRPPDLVGIEFLHSGKRRLFKVDDNLIHTAKQLCGFIRHRTQSLAAGDYPCRCGGKCKKDFAMRR